MTPVAIMQEKHSFAIIDNSTGEQARILPVVSECIDCTEYRTNKHTKYIIKNNELTILYIIKYLGDAVSKTLKLGVGIRTLF